MRRSSAVRSFVLGHALLALACGGGSSPAGPTAPIPAPSARPDATLGPAGGTVSASGGLARLLVPAGALTANVGLTLRATTQVPLDPHAVLRSAYEIAPVGTTFAVPATLTIRYDVNLAPSGSDEADLRLHVIGGGNAWEPLAGSTKQRRRSAAPVSTASAGWALAGRAPRPRIASSISGSGTGTTIRETCRWPPTRSPRKAVAA